MLSKRNITIESYPALLKIHFKMYDMRNYSAWKRQKSRNSKKGRESTKDWERTEPKKLLALIHQRQTKNFRDALAKDTRYKREIGADMLDSYLAKLINFSSAEIGESLMNSVERGVVQFVPICLYWKRLSIYRNKADKSRK